MTVCHRIGNTGDGNRSWKHFNRKIEKEILKTVAFTGISVLIFVTTV